jgi:hypothetical protein
MGFVKAFQLAKIDSLKGEISRGHGMVWFISAAFFCVFSILFLMEHPVWPFFAIVAAMLSQVIILTDWEDAKFGTIVNVLVILVAGVGIAEYKFEQQYTHDVKAQLGTIKNINQKVIQSSDLAHLPPPVQRYLEYVGVIGKPTVTHFRLEFNGEMRQKEKDWFSFSSTQHNTFHEPCRLFFIKGKMKGMPLSGYHLYQGENAQIMIKALSLFPVVHVEGAEMFQSETVTFFNDLCLFAPINLVDPAIEWEEISSNRARAHFTNKGVTITADLIFNEQGQLVNFISDDRFAAENGDMKQYRFSTPVRDYKEINGYRLPTYGEAVWHYPDGDFSYGKFHLQDLEYNMFDSKPN